MKKIVYTYVAVFFSYLIFAVSTNAYGDVTVGSISDEVLAIVADRVEAAIENGDNYAYMDDLEIYVELVGAENCQVYRAINSAVSKVWQEKGHFDILGYKESFCDYGLHTEPTDTAIELGNTYNQFMGVNIVYSNVYENDDGTGNTQKILEDSQKINVECKKALSVVSNDMTDFEKVLVLHDYLVAYVNYPDAAGTWEDGFDYFSDEHYKVAELLCRRQAVCCAYSRVYAILLKSCGIKSITVDNFGINHEWNMVYLDGAWYHVDVTWDDARYTEGITSNGDYNEDNWDVGKVSHEYFLKTGQEMRDIGRTYWNLGYDGGYEEFAGDDEKVPESAGVSHPMSALFLGEYYSGENIFNYGNGYWYILDINNRNLARIKLDNPSQFEYLNVDVTESMKYVYGKGKWLFICTDSSIYIYDTIDYGLEKKIAICDIAPELSDVDDICAFTEMNIIGEEMNVVITVGDKDDVDVRNIYYVLPTKDLLLDIDEISSEEEITEDTTVENEITTEKDTTYLINDENDMGTWDKVLYIALIVGMVCVVGLLVVIVYTKKKEM